MKKYLSLILIIGSIITSAAAFASADNDFIFTPEDGEVPYPPEVSVNDTVILDEASEENNGISLEEAEANKIWEDYGYTKEEFDEFPDALKNAMLYTPEEIGVSFGVPTKEDFARWEAKEKAEKEWLESKTRADEKNGVSTLSDTKEVRNSVGEFIQQTSYTCGPASARNAIHGYLWENYLKQGRFIPAEPWWGEVPSEERLADASNLNTKSNGTEFTTRWETVMNWFVPGHNYTLKWGTNSGWEKMFWTNVKSTIDKSNNYNVIVNLYGPIDSANQLNSEYKIGSSYAHYICVFGYDPNDNTVFVEDSHNTHSLHMYRTAYSKVAKACRRRGVIW